MRWESVGELYLLPQGLALRWDVHYLAWEAQIQLVSTLPGICMCLTPGKTASRDQSPAFP